jgi:hypothetical protein
MDTTQHLFSLNSDSVPIACSLDAAGVIDRRAEFEALFGSALVSQARDQSELRLFLAVQEDAERPVRDLFRRELECCPFFAFEFRRADDKLVVTIGVPDGADAILDAFSDMAAGAHT